MDYILGLDIGAASIGWALIEGKESNGHFSPFKIKKTGVRIFDAGVEGVFESGKTESRAKGRRMARLMRRGVFRDAQRRKRVFKILQEAGLLPGVPGQPSKIDDIIKRLDQNLKARLEKKLSGEGQPEERIKIAVHHNLPYTLRARCINVRLEKDELGRALYHLAQRRGFEGKIIKEEKKEYNQIQEGANSLQQAMSESGSSTLGEYFSKYNPFDYGMEKIRGKYTFRSMYKQEYDLLIAQQKNHYPDILTQDFRDSLSNAIFGQRPLKSQDHLIGKCALEKEERRAPWALLEAQRCRILQQLNHARISTSCGDARPLAENERDILLSHLENNSGLKFSEAKKLLGLGRAAFKIEEGGETKFVGDRTSATLAEILGKNWTEASRERKEEIIQDYLSTKDEDMPLAHTIESMKLDKASAGKLSNLELEPHYCSLSRKAIMKLLPLLEEGISYSEAKKKVYGYESKPEPLEKLPPVLAVFPDLANPAVNRTLTELRKIVNGVVREYGKPFMARIELARDLRKSKKQREDSWKRGRKNESLRKEAANIIAKETGAQNPKPGDIQKVLLAMECRWECPYSWRPISPTALLGATPEFEIEHIIPISRCLDDSFANKTLCHAEENRKKHGKTPWEAYSRDQEKWEGILQRVKKFNGDMAEEKLNRFKMDDSEEWEGFVSRQLNDTRYSSKVAADYLALLYGGRTDQSGKLRVQASKGQATFHLRNAWRLNGILNDGGFKSRDDHRHHAVDAVAIALTEPGTIKKLSDAAKRASMEGRRLFGKVDPPWLDFLNEVRKSIMETKVSHRPSKRIRGSLHEESLYGNTKEDGAARLRKTLGINLKPSELKNIADDKVREAVLNKLKELGYDPDTISDKDLTRVFGDSQGQKFENLPLLHFKDRKTGETKSIPIKKVRIKTPVNARKIGKGVRERFVKTGSNSHIEVFEKKDKKGKAKWEGRLVSSFEALDRLKSKKPVVNREDSDGVKLHFSLSGGDIIEMDAPHGKRELYRIRTISSVRNKGKEYAGIEYTQLNNARKKKDLKNEGQWKTALMEPLRKLNCRKVIITPLGEVRYAND